MDLTTFDAIVVNSSGGKDSQTALRVVVDLAKEQGVSLGKITVSHQDLGKMEWKGTQDLAKAQADHYGLRFEVSQYRTKTGEQPSLLDKVRARGQWPDNKNRYCTSDFKRGPGGRVLTLIAKELRAQGVARPRILNVYGFRAEESTNRAAKETVAPNTRMSSGAKEVIDWLPIHDMTEDQVWSSIKASGVPYHGAYDLGMPRLSCCFCIFAPRAALVVAGNHNPELLDQYCETEQAIGHTFRHKLPIVEIREAVHRGEQVQVMEMTGCWNM